MTFSRLADLSFRVTWPIVRAETCRNKASKKMAVIFADIISCFCPASLNRQADFKTSSSLVIRAWRKAVECIILHWFGPVCRQAGDEILTLPFWFITQTPCRNRILLLL